MRKYTVFAVCLVSLASFLVSLGGCGGRQALPEGMPKLTPCKVTINLGGAPLEGAIVGIVPENEANSRWSAGGTTDATGTVTIYTLGQYSGAVAGKYKVTVMKQIVDAPPDTLSGAERQTWVGKPTVEVVHKKYKQKESTPLEMEVGTSHSETSFDVAAP